MRAYQKILPEIGRLGARLAAISPMMPDSSLSMAEKNDLQFEVLSDTGNRVARNYGLVFRFPDDLRAVYREVAGIDLETFNGDDSWELPMPGTFVIGGDGLIRLASVHADYTRRLEPSDLLQSLRDLLGAGE